MALNAVRIIKTSWLITLLSMTLSSAQAVNTTEATSLDGTEKKTAISLHNEPKYKEGFTHFDYVNPNAPKGGTLKMATIGTFDSMNPFIEKGTPASGIYQIYDTLMVSSQDEPFSRYPLIAEAFEQASDNSSITFYLNKKARFHDHKPITAEDIQYTFNLLINKGTPYYRAYYNDVKSVNIINTHTVRFVFKHSNNKELPLILTELPVLPKHYWEKPENDFQAANLSFPLGSGPYRVLSADAGKQITYERVEDYWARNLPANAGRYNIDTQRYIYYRDANVAVEALKAGEYDIRFESSAKNWAQAYDTPATASSQLKKTVISTLSPEGMQGFVFNTRSPLFSERTVRKAIGYAMDFEWLNRTLFFNSYYRSNSYFANSEMAATGLPSEQELKLLKPYKDQLPAELFTQPYQLPITDGSGNIRKQLREALTLLEQEGWSLHNDQLLNSQQEPFTFELLLADASFERVALPFKKNLEKIGIEVNIRTIDVAQYINRLRAFDFDMLVSRIPQSNSPGNEQLEFWGSDAANTPGSRNLAGIQSPVVDALITDIIEAKTRKNLVTAVKALDRVLLWNEYVIPQWYLPEIRIVYWDKLQYPKSAPLYTFDLNNWWIKPLSANHNSTYTTNKKEDTKSNTELFIILAIAALTIIFFIRLKKRAMKR
ncbi:MAG: extracellular solute-binding protein [Endozoicomonas sp. (ex Botrylloides leachii)]|nr:extracellular solute-binding protein [Endozoicomonas sp. (ex Botrylloides leachii)]